MISEVQNEHFAAWWSYWGQLVDCVDPIEGGEGRTLIYGFENETEENAGKGEFEVPDIGACYGYVGTGTLALEYWVMGLNKERQMRRHELTAGEWFVTPGGFTGFLVESGTRVVITQRLGFRAVATLGGPIEELGRLRYIDSCSDTLLIAPPVKGEPCFNHLHFPVGIDQTQHFHPSNRSGMVARGKGTCATPFGESELKTGLLFHIPHHGWHKFATLLDSPMDVVAYHPDSDWGPEHETHPMINRTWVGEITAGHKMDPDAESLTVDGWPERSPIPRHELPN